MAVAVSFCRRLLSVARSRDWWLPARLHSCDFAVGVATESAAQIRSGSLSSDE